VGRYQKGKTSLDFTEARDCEWWWHQLGCMQVCTLLQTDNHASTPPLSFLQARCPTNSVKALAYKYDNNNKRKKDNNNKRICMAPQGRNFRGAGTRQCVAEKGKRESLGEEECY